METAEGTASGEPLSTDVWSAAFARGTDEREVPIVDLRDLGLIHDDVGFVTSEFLVELTPGAEAQPYLDPEHDVVYKLFDLRPDGSLGKKLVFESVDEAFEVTDADANWIDTMEKIAVINAGGGLPTELIGLADTGDYLLAKQPRAYPFEYFISDREQAEFTMRGIHPVGATIRQHAFVSHVDDEFWMVGDLHERNIMRDSNGDPTIIDALTGKITTASRKQLPWLDQACRDAQQFRATGTRPESAFDAVNDDEL